MTVSQLVLTFASDWLKVWCGFSSLIVKLSEGKTIQSQSSLNFLKIALFWLFSFQTGKPLMFRSEPPQTRRKQQDADKKQDKEEEELKYFFT